MHRPNDLIIGGDSLIGSALAGEIRASGGEVLATTRQKSIVNKQRPYLDLLHAEDFVIPRSAGRATILAAAVGYEDCQSNPLARLINEEKIPLLAERLLCAGIYVNFISTRFVFGDNQLSPPENASPAEEPSTAYGRQKLAGEKIIMESARQKNLSSRLAITRLTKVLAPSVPPLPSWFQSWRAGKKVKAFDDFFCSPLPIGYLVKSLQSINESGLSGIFHLSGASQLSYARLAEKISTFLGLSHDLVEPIGFRKAGIKLFYAPSQTSLTQNRTKNLLGLEPASLDELLGELANAWSSGK